MAEGRMQFMLMCCFDEERWNALPESERDDIMQRYGEWVDELKSSGHHIAGGKLEESASSTTVRVRDGKPVAVDGPFSESKEQIGGYHLLECSSREEAIRLAQKIPTLPAGGTVEVRPQMFALD